MVGFNNDQTCTRRIICKHNSRMVGSKNKIICVKQACTSGGLVGRSPAVCKHTARMVNGGFQKDSYNSCHVSKTTHRLSSKRANGLRQRGAWGGAGGGGGGGGRSTPSICKHNASMFPQHHRPHCRHCHLYLHVHLHRHRQHVYVSMHECMYVYVYTMDAISTSSN